MKANIELHCHPFINGDVNLTDIVETMIKKNINVVAAEAFNAPLFPQLVEEAKEQFPSAMVDEKGIKFSNREYILNAGEYETEEGLHVLTVGNSFQDERKRNIKSLIDESLEKDALVVLDHPFVDNGKTRTAGHISEEQERFLDQLCKGYAGQIAIEWNGYCIPWMRYILKHGLNLIGFDVNYHDINEKAKELSRKVNLPLVTDTDLHVRRKGHLDLIGTSKIESYLEGDSPEEIMSSLKRNIFNGKYTNNENYVSSIHLLEAFCLPILFPQIYDKPRA